MCGVNWKIWLYQKSGVKFVKSEYGGYKDHNLLRDKELQLLSWRDKICICKRKRLICQSSEIVITYAFNIGNSIME